MECCATSDLSSYSSTIQSFDRLREHSVKLLSEFEAIEST